MNRATKTALTAALPFMMLPLTVAGPLPTAAAAAVELPPGPATVLHTGPTPWSTPTNFGGIICELERECREVYYQYVMPLGTFEPGLAENVKTMNFALNNTEGNKVAYGFSGGARVVSKWLEDNADSTAISPEELSVLLVGNGGRKYGGINGWFYRDSLMTPTDTPFSVTDVAREYDPIADFPDNPFNLLALANAISAFGNVHMKYSEADLNAPGNYVWTEGNTTYVFIPTAQLPLLAGLRTWGMGALADQLEAPLRAIIDKAYKRDYLADAEVIGESDDEDDANPVQPVAAAIPTGPGEACSGYNTDGCDIEKDQSYTPITAPNLENAAWQNVLPNLFNALISVPRAYLDGLNDLSHALEVTGSWWVYTPTNVLGYDPADPPKITAVTNLLIPFKPLSNALGEHVSWWAKANLPMDAGCTGTAPPTCKDANSILSKMFLAPIWDLVNGYKFPELNNPVSEEEGAAGEEIPGQTGAPVPWSGEAVQLNPWDPVYNTLNYLFAPPEQNRPEPITFTEVVESVVRFGKALWLDFNPFVPGSFLWKGYPYTLVTPFIKPFVKLLCPSCDPENPGDPTPFSDAPENAEEQGVQSTEGAEDTALLASSTEAADEGTASEEGTEQDSVVNTAVNDLLQKFKLAPQEEEAAPVDEKSGDEAGQEQPADEVTDETPAAEDEGKTETGTPAETKPDTGVDEGKDEAGDPTETESDAESDAADEDQDKGAVSEDSEKPSTGGKHRKTDTADSSNESTSGADSNKESAGASSGGSDSGE
ncbi:PE-PPE domain-containing protein [Mycobacterium sp. 4D054]|uniref:PE-PPE domain-containing protein n=1 Tax=Mycobacterium sp. 4D054 TaxID=3457440 RepID=UPI003FD0D5D1